VTPVLPMGTGQRPTTPQAPTIGEHVRDYVYWGQHMNQTLQQGISSGELQEVWWGAVQDSTKITVTVGAGVGTSVDLGLAGVGWSVIPAAFAYEISHDGVVETFVMGAQAYAYLNIIAQLKLLADGELTWSSGGSFNEASVDYFLGLSHPGGYTGFTNVGMSSDFTMSLGVQKFKGVGGGIKATTNFSSFAPPIIEFFRQNP